MAKNWVLIVTQCNNGFCWTAYVTSKDVAYLPQNRETLVMTADAVGVEIAAFANVFAIGI